MARPASRSGRATLGVMAPNRTDVWRQAGSQVEAISTSAYVGTSPRQRVGSRYSVWLTTICPELQFDIVRTLECDDAELSCSSETRQSRVGNVARRPVWRPGQRRIGLGLGKNGPRYDTDCSFSIRTRPHRLGSRGAAGLGFRRGRAQRARREPRAVSWPKSATALMRSA